MLHGTLVRLLTSAAISLASVALSAAEPVPNTLEQAFSQLDKQLPLSEREAFKMTPEQQAVVRAHMGLGMYIRNEWFRKGRSALPKLLQARHLDDASSIVLTSYWRHLNGKPLEVDAQVDCYSRWWAEQQRLIEAAKSADSSSHETPAFSCPEG